MDTAKAESAAAIGRYLDEHRLTAEDIHRAAAEGRSIVADALGGMSPAMWRLLPAEDREAILAWSGKDVEQILALAHQRHPAQIAALAQHIQYLAKEINAAKARLKAMG